LPKYCSNEKPPGFSSCIAFIQLKYGITSGKDYAREKKENRSSRWCLGLIGKEGRIGNESRVKGVLSECIDRTRYKRLGGYSIYDVTDLMKIRMRIIGGGLSYSKLLILILME
jgi:hypothetical protein